MKNLFRNTLIATIMLILSTMLVIGVAFADDRVTGSPPIDIAITDITDSDTFTIGGDAWHVRLQHVDIPSAAFPHCEKERLAGLQVIEQLKTKLLPQAKSITVSDYDFTHRFTVTPVNMQVDGRDLAQLLIDEGLARRYTWNYTGWC